MAAVICNNSPIVDPTRSGKYPISLSEELLREDLPRKRQKISVQYSYKPKIVGGQKSTIKPSDHGQDNAYSLSIDDEEGKGSYNYTGFQRGTDALVLIYDSNKQAFVLDKLDAEFSFNLQSTPSNKDAANLAAQYPQLDTAEPGGDGDDLFGEAEGEEEDPDDVPADPSNPYDYRHFLRRGGSPSPEPSIRSSPVPNHAIASSPHLAPSSTASRHRSHTEPKKPSQVRQQCLSPISREEADADTEGSDPNELVIDMGDSASTNKPWRSALGMLNGGGRGSGPISLRSAASSMSPPVRGGSEDEKGDKSDPDIEDIDLGDSQMDAAGHGAPGEDITKGIGWDDDDDGILQAELEQALEEQAEHDQMDARDQHIAAVAESSSESEEE